MKREFKVGDLVICIDKRYSDLWKRETGISLYGKIAKIIYIDKYDYYLLEFKDWINSGIVGWDNVKDDYGKWCRKKEIKLAVDHLKFKKWIKG